jgi:predicted SnoaL-like aldol condensation-catalyzing enzyme
VTASNRFLALAAVALVPLAACSPAPNQATDGEAPGAAEVMGHPDPLTLLDHADPVLAANKRLVFDMWRSVVNAGHVELADTMLAEGYRQHSPVLPTGREAFRQIFSAVERRDIPDLVSPPLVAILAEGDLVVMALREDLTGPDGDSYTSTHFNLFRVESGRLAEHWHSVQAPPGPDLPPPGEGGPWPVEGVAGGAQFAMLAAGEAALAANKRLVFDMWREVLDGGDGAAIERYFAPDFVEHDPRFGSRYAGLAARLGNVRPAQDTIDAEVVAIVAEGDLVTVVTCREHSHPHRAGAIYTTAHFDMFRVIGGRIAAHWSGEARPGGVPAPYGN